LDLRDFKKLREIYFPNHQLTKIDLNNFSQIEKINCPNNKLIDINSLLSNLNPEKLKELDLSNNNFSESDLTSLSKFVNLEVLNISDNNFRGSLEPLKNLTKLRELYIFNTNISSGLEYLPDSLEVFKCYDVSREKSESKATKLYKKELSDFEGDIKI
jgi:Leucine-rich repeat (LRR) protein